MYSNVTIKNVSWLCFSWATLYGPKPISIKIGTHVLEKTFNKSMQKYTVSQKKSANLFFCSVLVKCKQISI